MRLSRRAFFAVSAASLIAPARGIATPAQDLSSFRGAHPGDQRVIEGLRVRWCPPGRFRMGSPPAEQGRRPDEAQVDVTLTRGFFTGAFEVTQGEWRRIVGDVPDRRPSPAFGEGDDFPMYWVNFEQAETFCRALTARARRSGALPATWAFALPTEAQWEYACRAGTTTASAFGPTLTTTLANFDPEAETRTTRLAGGSRRVGSYPANAWGLHDMHGNVWEWCRDYYHAQLPGGTDPDLSDRLGVQNGDGSFSRVRRGGAWIEADWTCRSACRLRYEPHRSSDHIGFRVIVEERG
ncbi:MAG: formylglycine-generating enzyme family protein [Acidobacteria bacterium]|nr:formylglycine-generating enzyme family protein [Acidobacteriota bacterium]